MNFRETVEWMQAYWFELGSLLLQCAILATLAWFGRKAFRQMSATHVAEPVPVRVAGPRRAQVMVRVAGSGARQVGSALSSAARGVANWLQSPTSGSFAPWRRVIRWLQAPSHS